MNSLKEQYEGQIHSLKEQNQQLKEIYEMKLKELQNQIFEIAKQPKQHNINNNHTTTQNNQRTLNIVNQLAPLNLQEQEKWMERIKEEFTAETFYGGSDKIIELANRTLLTDPETQKPKVICTDINRRHYRYIDENTGELKTDPGFQILHDNLRFPLSKANLQFFLQILEFTETDRKIFSSNDDFINSRKQFSDKLLKLLNE